MNIIKKLLASLTALVMVVGSMIGGSLPVMAAGETDGSITITNPVKGESYSVYKVFDGVPENADASEQDRKIAYTYDGTNHTFLTALQSADSPFTVEGTSAPYNITLKKNVESKGDAGKEDVITFLNSQKDNLGTATTETGPESGSLVFANLSYGYYYVTTTTGSAVSIDSAAKAARITDKNSAPSVDKKQSKSKGSDYTDNKLNLNIGDKVYFKIIVTAGKTNDKQIEITDTLSNGLTLNHSGSGTDITLDDWSIKKYTNGSGEGTDLQNSDFTIFGVTERGFKVHLLDSFVKTLNGGNGGSAADTVVITYSATLNNNAAIDNQDNTNTVELKYSQQTTTDVTHDSTYDFLLKKHKETEDGAFLPGAGFRLYDKQTGGNEIKLTKEAGNAASEGIPATDDKYYVDKNKAGAGDEIMVNTANGINVRGLEPGTYYLEETTVPSGYNKLTSRVAVTITDNRTDPVPVNAVNNSGSVLPSTGGIGTTIFYIAGGILIVAAVLLIARRKKSNA
jgi:fimbrial isopeptide formation D2 family protein/LPXTG-motif cell wall-anchored protein